MPNQNIPDPDCEFCGGTGEIEFDEPLESGSAVMVPTGVGPCPCTFPEPPEEEYDDQEN